LLSDSELQEWAEELEIDSQSMGRLHALISRRALNFWLGGDPQETARWIVSQLGWDFCQDLQEALCDAMDAVDEVNDSK
jgi:hypothetical protein